MSNIKQNSKKFDYIFNSNYILKNNKKITDASNYTVINLKKLKKFFEYKRKSRQYKDNGSYKG
jgi:hypothetical protein